MTTKTLADYTEEEKQKAIQRLLKRRGYMQEYNHSERSKASHALYDEEHKEEKAEYDNRYHQEHRPEKLEHMRKYD